jgi:hypothetical protein
MSSKNRKREKIKESPMAEQPIHPTYVLGILLPIKPLMTKPMAGKRGTNHM